MSDSDFELAIYHNVEQVFNSLSSSNQHLVWELMLSLHSTGPPPNYSDDFQPHEIVNQWIEYLLADNKSPSTIRGYVLYVNMLLQQFPQPTAAQIDVHLVHSRSQIVTPGCINMKITAFKRFFSYCMEKGYLSFDPSLHLKPIKCPLRVRRCPPISDVQKLLSLDLSVRDRALLFLLLDAGLRLAEVSNIKVSDIMETSLIVIGKGDKQRLVPLSPFSIYAVLDQYRQLLPGSIYLFPGRFPGKPWCGRSIEDHLHFLCKEAGIAQITPHQLRHLFATEMLKSGVSLKIVSELLGHSTPAVTSTVYWHVDAGEKERQHSIHSPLKKLREGVE